MHRTVLRLVIALGSNVSATILLAEFFGDARGVVEIPLTIALHADDYAQRRGPMDITVLCDGIQSEHAPNQVWAHRSCHT